MRSHSLLVKSALLVCTVVFSISAHGQCRSFAKNKCVPELAPYKFSETFNAAQLAPGEEAEIALTLYSGQDYRILVCTHPILGEVNWKLLDQNNKVIFESLADEPKHFFDLKAAATVPVKVVVWVPGKGKGSMVHVGCVAIMLGFKE